MNREIKVFGKVGCPGCMLMSPILMELLDLGFNIQFLTQDDNPQLFMDEQIKAMPTMKFYDNGIQYSKTVGEVPKEAIINIYQKNIDDVKTVYETRHEQQGW